jgi:protein O-GlcNAc transferase
MPAASNNNSARIPSLLAHALGLHQQGQFAQAGALYEEILALQPDHFDALHLLGMLKFQAQDFTRAVELISRAIAVNPQNPNAYYNRAVTNQALGQMDAALKDYDKAIALKPDYASAYYNRGVVLQKQEQYPAALESYERAIALNADHADACNNRGACLQHLKRYREAIENFTRALVLKPAPDTYYNRGMVLDILKQPQAALEDFDRAIALAPNYAEAYYQRGNAQRSLLQFQAAFESFTRALAIKPDYADACYNRAVALQDLKMHDEAMAAYNKAAELYGNAITQNPGDAVNFYNRGNALKDAMRLSEALESYKEAILKQSDYADAHWAYGMGCLLAGDLSTGWKEYEWRWRREEKQALLRNFKEPLWTGAESLQGRTILLYSEQGLGDTLQFCRYAEQVASLGATVILEARKPLIPLLRSLKGVSRLITEGEALPPFDFQCPLMSLPMAFNTTLNDIPATIPYLSVEAKRTAEWRAQLGSPSKLRVGLAWSGSRTHKNDLNRSIPLALLIDGLPSGAQYISLQKDLREGDEEILRAPAGDARPEILHFGEQLTDFSDTAALCELCDLVISVDTSIAHLAGAMGKQLWLLLPYHPEWRWLLERKDSPWYPGAKLYRQQKIGDWAGMMQRIRTDLSSFIPHEKIAAPAANLQNAQFYYTRGNLLQTQGDLQAAIENYHKAVSAKPDFAEAHNNRGIAHLASGNTSAAIKCFSEAIRFKPQYAKAYNNLGNALQAQGKFLDAAAHYAEALKLDPNYVDAHNNLGNTQLAAGKFEDAVMHYNAALQLDPANAQTFFNLGSAFQSLNRADAAIEHYQKALELHPYYLSAYLNLGAVLLGQGILAEAEQNFRKVLELQPDDIGANSNLGNALVEQGRLDEAIETYRKTLSLNPTSFEAHSNLLLALSYQASPGDYLAEAHLYGEKAAAAASPCTSWKCAADTTPPLRVGLVSGDLRVHPVGFFLESVIANLAPERIKLIAYSTVIQEDGLTQRIKPYFTEWHNIAHLSDPEAACKIHGDGIHILIDLAGHTAHNRLPVFAFKPAPVQAGWLGYFASTGVATIDCVLADPVSLPKSLQGQFTELIKYLPETRMCFTAPDDATGFPVSPPPVLQNGYVTFGSFQKLFKINDAVLSAWGRIFTALPAARLRLQNAQVNCPVTRERLLERLATAGISRERVTLKPQATREDYFRIHAEVDIILDTFNYTGGTTTFEALWMGVPTVTLAGNSMLSRQGASIMTNAGLQDWVAENTDDYVALALRHAADSKGLAKLRTALRQQALASPLYDAPRFARNLEAVLFDLWQDRP